MPTYSPQFKESVVRKATAPGAPSIQQLAVDLNLQASSIRNWVKFYARASGMRKSKEWTPEAKLEAIIKSTTMSENELGEYLRANGLHSSELEQWKQEFYSSQKGPGRPRIDPELANLKAKEKELTKDLKRKDRALAEMSARIVLLKKSRLIWGDGEDDE
jgi:transposase